MIEKWNFFVYDLCEAKKKDVDEDSFHALIETQLQHLGWAKYKGEICHKQNIHLGNSNRIEPDILIKRDGEDEFVIEVKRPSHKQIKKDVDQLLSYMRILKLNVGIYIGEYIEVHTGTDPTVYELSMRIPNILPFSIEYGMSEFINNPNMEINFYKNHLFLKNIFGITK